MADINDLTPALIMSGQAQQRENCILCDVQLQTEGKLIPAHRSVLAAASPFFRGMFTADFKEKTDDVVKMNDLTSDALNVVIEAVYRHNLVLSNELVPEVLHASHMLQMNGIVEKCKAYMMENLSQLTCFTFLGLGEKYKFKDLISKANDFVLANFVEISKSAEFKNISKQALCYYLSSDTLNFKSNEIETFEAAQRWLEAEEDRMQFVGEVMNNVRFMLLDANTLAEISDRVAIKNSSECQGLIRDAFVYQANIYEQPLKATYQNRPRGKEGVLTIEEGYSTPGESGVYHGLHKQNVACHTEVNQGFLLESLSGVKLNNFVFLFGADDSSHLPFMMRYNVSTNIWVDLKPFPKTATVGSTCTLVNEYIYLLGGMFVNDGFIFGFNYQKQFISNLAYHYLIPANKWQKIGNIPQPLAKSASCSIGKVVHITGGVSPVQSESLYVPETNKHYSYDIPGSLWLTKPPMRHARSGHVMEAVDSTLYVFGGEDSDADVEVIESFDTSSEQWTEIQTAKFSGIFSSAFVWDGIYLTGGLIREGGAYCVNAIHRFDINSGCIAEQENGLQLPGNGHFSAMMVLPKLLYRDPNFQTYD